MTIDWADQIRRARDAGEPSRFLELVPYARFLGLSAALEGDELRCTMAFSDHLVGDSSIPALHGGTTGALLESAAIVTVLFTSDTERLPKTINLTVDYLRSGRAKDTHAAAEIVRAGRRVVTVRATAWQDDRAAPIATADCHFLVSSR